MKKSILSLFVTAALAFATLPCISQSNLLNLTDINDLSQVNALFELFPTRTSAQSQQHTSLSSQLDYIAYTLAWDYDAMEHDSSLRTELVTEEVDGKANWTLTAEFYDEMSGSHVPGERIEVFNARIGMDEDPEDGSVIPADSLLLYVYDDAYQEYTLLLSSYYFPTASGKLDYSVATFYFYGLPFFSTVQQNYYDAEETLIAMTIGDGISTQDSTVFSYNGMDQLIQEIVYTYDGYGGTGSSEVTDYSYNGDESPAFVRTLLYSDWFTTLVGVDSTAYTYPSADMYTESFYFFDVYSGEYILNYFWDYTSTGDKEIEEQYQEGNSGLVNVEYLETTFDECDRPIEGINILRLLDGTEDTRDTSIFFYREEPSCTVSTNQVESARDQFTYIMDGQLLTVLFDESDRGIISMFTVDGRTVNSVKYDGMQGEIDVSHLASGVYYLSVVGERIHGVIGVFVK